MFLVEHEVRQSRPAFYILMGRLEQGGFVVSELLSRSVQGQTLNERTYQITKEGRRMLQAAFEFYDHLKNISDSETTQPAGISDGLPLEG